jgi:hypothetical protein
LFAVTAAQSWLDVHLFNYIKGFVQDPQKREKFIKSIFFLMKIFFKLNLSESKREKKREVG